MTQTRLNLVGIGEALWDVYPDRETLGGAPLNVAVTAHQLLQAHHGAGVVVSRVGQDARGDRLRAELAQRGMGVDHIQTDPDRDTGCVDVSFDADRRPRFQIALNAAWDVIQLDPDTEDLARQCNAVCFGSLALRDAQSRNTIYRFLDAARRAVRLFDVNLRPDCEPDSRTLRRCLELANVLKVNDAELTWVCDQLGVSSVGAGRVDQRQRQCEAILKEFALQFVVLTQGQRGTLLLDGQQRYVGALVNDCAVDGADELGAGDAVSAAVLVGMMLRRSGQQIVDFANRLAAFVAGQLGATPTLPDDLVAGV